MMNKGTLRSGNQAGFTLIELAVTLMIIGVMAGMLIPRLPDVTASRLKSSARKLAGVISHIYDRAASSQLTYRLTFDLDEESYYISLLNSQDRFEETDLPLAHRAKLPSTLDIHSARTQTQGKVIKGKANLHFFPGGFVERATIYLQDAAGNRLTLQVHPLTGRVMIRSGFLNNETKKS